MPEAPIIDSWFFSPRGDCVEIRNQNIARSALNNGFVRLTEEERMRFKPGDYHPGHDLGDGSTVAVAQPQQNLPPTIAVKEFEVIEL